MFRSLFRNWFEILLPRSGKKKVARRETSGIKRINLRALKMREECSTRASSAGINMQSVPDVSRLATFLSHLRCEKLFFKQFLTFLLLLSCAIVVNAQQTPVTPKPTTSPTPKIQTPQVQIPTPPAQVPKMNNPTLAPFKPMVYSVVQKLNSFQVLALLKSRGAEIKSVDSNFVFNFYFHTNIVAGFPLGDGQTIVTRLPQTDLASQYLFQNAFTAPGQTPRPSAKTRNTPAPQNSVVWSPPVQPTKGVGNTPTAPTPFPQLFSPQGSFLVFTNDGKEQRATVLGFDGLTGLSLLRVEGLQETPLPEAELKELVIGQNVNLIAPRPMMTPPTQSNTGRLKLKVDALRGTLKSLERGTTGEIKSMTVSLTNISPELVGGVVMNEANEAIGMIEGISVNEARVIPISNIKLAADRVRAQAARKPQPWLGVRGEAIANATLYQLLVVGWKQEQATKLLKQNRGILLTSVPPETPAAQSQLKIGDVILRVNQNEVANSDDFTNLLYAGEDKNLIFTLLRPNAQNTETVNVKLGETPSPTMSMALAESRAFYKRSLDVLLSLGIETVLIKDNSPEKTPMQNRLVFYVYPESVAERAGLQAGDVIESVNGVRPNIVRLLPKYKGEITLSIIRNNQKLTLKINKSEETKQ